MNSLPIKCTSNNYRNEPFYLIQTNEDGKRYVVSLSDTFRIRILLSGFIDNIKNNCQLKIRSLDEDLNLIVYTGKQSRDRLHALITEFEDVIFHNGRHDLIIQNPDSGDYLTFDDHGLIYIDTDEDYSAVLNNLGAEHKPDEKLIYQGFHWHHSTEQLNEQLADFINAWGLTKDEYTSDNK